jgi:putative transposase
MEKIEFKATNYPSDLTDTQWEQIAEYIPQGPNSEHHKRTLLNGVLYLVNNGCKWRALPHDFPPYSTVHSFYRRARLSGLWEKILEAVVQNTRLTAERNATPSYGIIDSQSVKTVYASEKRGIDGGKKRKVGNVT